MKKTPPMLVETRPLADLTADPRNARTHSERNITEIAASLERFGQRKPIVVTKDGQVVAGNGTMEAAAHLGWTDLVVTVFPGTVDEARAYAIADNRTGELATWDQPVLLTTLAELSPDLLESTGWSLKEVADMETLWGPPPLLDDLVDGLDDHPVTVRVVVNVPPEVATMWKKVCESTGIEHPDAAGEAVIRAAFRGVSG